MLQTIRERLTGWVAWTILGLVAVALVATMGVSSYFEGGPAQIAARVNGEDVSMMTFQRLYEQQRQRLQQQMGDQFDPSLINQPAMKGRILDQLVSETLLAQFVDDGNFRVGDEELKKQIKDLDIFKENNVFSKQRYDAFLRNNAWSDIDFRNLFRRNTVINQLQEGLSLSGFATQNELESAAALQGQERSIAYVRVPVDKFKTSMVVSDAEIQSYFKENAQRYMTPERVKLLYIELSAEKLAEGVPVDDAAVKTAYDERVQAGSMGIPEERKASHILVRVAEGADDATVQKAKEKATELLAQIKGGADFAELAKKNSEDPGSGQQGGDLGFFKKGVMHEAFEKAAFGLQKEGDLSDVVRTPFGFHVIKLTGIKAEHIKTLEEAKADLMHELKMVKAEQLFAEKSEKLQELVFVNPDTLDVAAKELGLTVQHSDWIAKEAGGSGVLANPDVMKAAFSDTVIKEGKNSEPVKAGNNVLVVIRKQSYEAPKQKELAEVKDQIVDRLKYSKGLDKVKEVGAQIMAALKEGKAIADVAKTQGLEVKDVAAIKRDATSEDHEIVAKVFQMAKPVGDKPVNDGISLVSGDYVALQLKAVKPGSLAAMKPEEKQGLERRLAMEDGSAAMANLLKHLNRVGSIKKYEDRL